MKHGDHSKQQAHNVETSTGGGDSVSLFTSIHQGSPPDAAATADTTSQLMAATAPFTTNFNT